MQTPFPMERDEKKEYEFEQILKRIEENHGLIKTKEIQEMGIDIRRVHAFVEEGRLTRVKNGYYTSKALSFTEEDLVVSMFPDGILTMESGAYYTFAFEGECTAGKLAQVPVSFFFTSIPLAVMVWNGTDGQKAVKRVRFKVTTRSNVFRLHFGQNGVKLDCVRITKDGPGDDRQIGLLPD